MKKRKKKLSKLQKRQRIETEFKVLEFLDGGEQNNKISLFRDIKKATKIDNKVLRNALDRLILKKQIIEIPMITKTTHKKIDSWGFHINRKYVTNAKGYKLVSEEEYEKNQREKKALAKLRQKRNLPKPIREERNSLLNEWKNYPSKKVINDLIRREIFKAMMKIDYMNRNEEKVLDELGLTKKTFESWIKRSPRLQWLRNELIKYKNKNQQLPLGVRWGEYQIPHSLTQIKRNFQYPNEIKSYWFRKRKIKSEE